MNKLIVANWKMNLDCAESLKLGGDYLKLFKKSPNQVVVCPSFLPLAQLAANFKNSLLSLGAQDAFWTLKGAYTGEISAASLRSLACTHVILGHSERRQYLAESCRMINAKAQSALDAGLTPIICVGEDAAKRKAGRSASFITGQVQRALKGLKLAKNSSLVIAYEPIWAIGTGKVSKATDTVVIHQLIRRVATKILGANTKIKVIYGGSVDLDNAASLLAESEIDGFLIGGASLSASNFYKIANIK